MNQKKVAILQSNYIPWKGYFDLIKSVDEFVLYDDMQYTKNDWRNRNKIKTQNGLQWLSIPVRQESLHQKINETKAGTFLSPSLVTRAIHHTSDTAYHLPVLIGKEVNSVAHLERRIFLLIQRHHLFLY